MNPATAIRAFNLRQQAARREYALHPTAFADDPLCIQCQEKRREYGSQTCAGCRHRRRRGTV